LNKLLLVFDQGIDAESVRGKVKELAPDEICIFPLTSRWDLITDIEKICYEEINDISNVYLEETASLIDVEVDELREKLAKWSADFGRCDVHGKSLREWFLLPEKDVSTWWFSLISEKSMLKTNIFLHFAQLKAVSKIVAINSFNVCCFSVTGKDYSSSIRMLCEENTIKGIKIKAYTSTKGGFRCELIKYFTSGSFFASVCGGAAYLIKMLYMTFVAKAHLGSLKKRLGSFKGSVLFASFFPFLDKEAAERGELVNKYIAKLQEKVLELEKKIVWIWMYVPLEGNTYSGALNLSKKFTKKGENNFFLNEFLSMKIFLKIIFAWIRQVIVFLKIKKSIPVDTLSEQLALTEGRF